MLPGGVVVKSPERSPDMRTSLFVSVYAFVILWWHPLQKGDHVRVHVIDAVEASLFLQEGRFLTGVVVGLKAVHDSSLVEVVGLGGAEAFLVPNTRMEIVAAEDSARVIDTFELERNQVMSGVRGSGCCLWNRQASSSIYQGKNGANQRLVAKLPIEAHF